MPLTVEKITEQNLGVQYLHGELSEEQQAEFEVFLMENPNYLDELELLKVFNENLPEAKMLSITKNSAESSTREIPRMFSFIQLFGGMAFGAIATVLIYSGIDKSNMVYSISNEFYLETMRSSAATLPIIELPKKDDYIVISAPLNPDQRGKINIKLIELSSNKVVVSLDGLSPNTMNEVSFLINSKLLAPVKYELVASDLHGKDLRIAFNAVN